MLSIKYLLYYANKRKFFLNTIGKIIFLYYYINDWHGANIWNSSKKKKKNSPGKYTYTK